MIRPLLFACPLLLLACTAPDAPEQEQELEESIVLVDFRQAMDSPSVDVVGVTIRPDTGQRYVLDSARGIYEVDSQGEVSLVRALSDFPIPDQELQSEFTDIASLGGEQFALTARNEGYLLDLGANTLTRHFCYLPDDLDDEEVYQVTHSVTFDSESQQIYAQPQTFSLFDDSVFASSIGQFAQSNGDEQTWYPLEEIDYIAGAIASMGNAELVLAQGDTLRTFDLAHQVLSGGISLEGYSISDITGLAVDASSKSILIVDGASQKLVALPLAVLD